MCCAPIDLSFLGSDTKCALQFGIPCFDADGVPLRQRQKTAKMMQKLEAYRSVLQSSMCSQIGELVSHKRTPSQNRISSRDIFGVLFA